MVGALSEPVFVNLLRSPEIDSQPGGINYWVLKGLQIQALMKVILLKKLFYGCDDCYRAVIKIERRQLNRISFYFQAHIQ
jgi:hypothetical protein